MKGDRMTRRARGFLFVALALVAGGAAAFGRRFLLVVGLLAAAAPAASAGDIEIKGKYMVIHAPAAEKASAERLAKLGDRALELYAKDLGAAVPKEPFRVFLYGTIKEYEAAEDARTHGVFKGNLAYTHRDTCDVLMYIQPRPGRAANGDEGMMEALFAHELCHALQYRLFPPYDEIPNWLSEGISDAWSERALSRGDALLADKSPWYASFLLDVHDAIDDGRYIGFEKLTNEVIVGHDFAYRQLRYAECFAFVRMLDSPAKENAARRAKFRAFLKEIYGWQKTDPDAFKKKVNDRFAEVFGPLEKLQRELVKKILAEDAFPWHILSREIRAVPDGSLCAEAFPESTSLAFSAKDPVEPLVKVQAEAEVGPDTRQVNVAFSYRSRNDYYMVAFGVVNGGGYCTLMHYVGNGKYDQLKSMPVDAAALAAGKHQLRLDIDVDRIWAKLDGKVVLDHVLPDGNFPKGRWGLGVYDGRVIFRNAEAIPVTK